MIRNKSAKKTDKKAGKGQAGLPKGVIAVAPPSFRREQALIKRGVWPVAGCDEAGRGPLAGAAASPDRWWRPPSCSIPSESPKGSTIPSG